MNEQAGSGELLAVAREMLGAERASTLERLAGLEREFGGIIESASSANADDEHDPEGATIAFERQHIAALVSQAREHLDGIDSALRKLDDGSYGVCEICGRPVGDERLAARPTATRCVRCASRP
jgi:RNA polymerase-binding transcription factor